MKPGGLCSPSDGSSSPSGDDIGSVSAACKAIGGGSQFPDASTSEDSPACLTPDLIEDRHQGVKPSSSIANGYICNDVTNGLCETLYDTEKDIDVPRHVLSPPCSEDGEEGGSRSRSSSAGGGAFKGSDPSTLYQGRCKTPEPLKGKSPAPSNKAKSLPPQLSIISLDESPAVTSEHSSFSVYNESVDVKVACGSNCSKETSCSEPQSTPHNVKSPKYRRKCSLEEMVAKLHSRSDPIVPTGLSALQVFSPTRTNPEPKQEGVASCFTKTEGDGELSSLPQSEHGQSICDNSNTATSDVHLPTGSSSSQAFTLHDSEETARACDEPCVYNANSAGDWCGGVKSSVGKDPDYDRNKLVEKEITCESDTSEKNLGVSSSPDGESSPVAVIDSDLTDTRTAYLCVSNDNVSSVPKDAQSGVLVDVSRTTSEKVTIENDAKFELNEKRCTSRKCDSSSINKNPQNISIEAIERKESDEVEVLTSHEKGVENEVVTSREKSVGNKVVTSCVKDVENEVINLVDDDTTGDSGSDLEIIFEKGRNIGTGKLATICSKRLGKGKTEKKECVTKSSLAGSRSGKVEYLEPISDEENSLICAPSPPSELSSASGFPSSSDTPLFSDTPSDASRGAIMVKISDAVAAILSDVSDDSLPPSPKECSDQNSFSNIIPKLIEMNNKCSGSPVRSSSSGTSVADSIEGESSSGNQKGKKGREELETTPSKVTSERVTSGDGVCDAQSDDKKCESSDLILISSAYDTSCEERPIDSPKNVEVIPTSANENDSNHIEHTKTKSINISLDLSESQEQSANVGVPSSSTSEDSGSSGHSGPPQLVKSLVHRFPCSCSCSMHSTALLSNDPCNTNSLCQKPTSGTPCLSSQPNICNRLRSECRECVPGLDGDNVSRDACSSCMSIGELHVGVHRKEEPSTSRDSKDPIVAAVSDVGNENKEAETSEIYHGNILSSSVPDECEEPNTSSNGIPTHPPNIPKKEVEIAVLSEDDKVKAETMKSAVASDVVDKMVSLTTSVSASSSPEPVLVYKDLSSSVLRDDSGLQTTNALVESTEGSTNPASTSVAIDSSVDLSSNIAFYEGRSHFPGSSVDDDSSAPAESITKEDEISRETQDSSNGHSLPKVSEGGCMPTQELSSDSKLQVRDNLSSSNSSIGQVSNVENLSQLSVPNHTNQILLGIVSCKISDNSVNTLSQNLNSEIERTAQNAYSETSSNLAVKSGISSEVACSDNKITSIDSDNCVPPSTTDAAIPNPISNSNRVEEAETVSSSAVTETQSVHTLPLNPKEPRRDSLDNSNAPDISQSWNSLENPLALPSPHKTSHSQESHLCQPLHEGPTERITSKGKDTEHQHSVITESPKVGRTDLSVNLEHEYASGGEILTSTAEEEKTESIPISESESSKDHLAEPIPEKEKTESIPISECESSDDHLAEPIPEKEKTESIPISECESSEHHLVKPIPEKEKTELIPIPECESSDDHLAEPIPHKGKTESIPISECESSKDYLAEASRESGESEKLVEGDCMNWSSHSVDAEEPVIVACNSPRIPESVTLLVPTKSVTPFTPIEDVMPSAPTDDVTPSAPTEDVTPSAPTEDVTPSAPTEDVTPLAPTEDVTPLLPTGDVTPLTPTVVVTPSAPTEDVTHLTPTEDVTPSAPSDDVTPSAPSEDVTPSASSEDVTPSAPTEDVTLSAPTKDVTPLLPTEDVTHLTPTKDVTPVTPTRDVTPLLPTEDVTHLTPTEDVTPLLPTEDVTHLTPTKEVTPLGPTKDVIPSPPIKDVTPSLPTEDVTPLAPTEDVTPLAPTEDVTPLAPTEDVTPSTPTEDVIPLAPNEDVTPSTPTEEVTPSVPNEDVTPLTPTEDVTPLAPTEDITPSTPTEDVTPSAPTEDVTPLAPTEDVTPSTPTEDVTPLAPNEDVTPSTPTEDVTPSTPTEDVTPSTPTEDVTPSTPTEDVTPYTPTEDVTPSTPTEDVTPSTPKESEDLNDNSVGNTSPKESSSGPSNDGISIKEQLSDTIPLSSDETELDTPSASSNVCLEGLAKLVNFSANKDLIGTADSQATDSNILAIPPKVDQTETLQGAVITETNPGQDGMDRKNADGDSELYETPTNAEPVDEKLPGCCITNVQAEPHLVEVVCPLLPKTEDKLTDVSNLEVKSGHPGDLLTEAVNERDATRVMLGVDLSEMQNSTLFETKNCIFPNQIGLNPSATTQPVNLKVSESSSTTISSTKSDPILSERIEGRETDHTINEVHTSVTGTLHEAKAGEKSAAIPVGENTDEEVAPECDNKNETLGKKDAAELALNSINTDMPGKKEDVNPSKVSEDIENKEICATELLMPSTSSAIFKASLTYSCDSLKSSSLTEFDRAKTSSETSEKFSNIGTSDNPCMTKVESVSCGMQSNNVTKPDSESISTEIQCNTSKETDRNSVSDVTGTTLTLRNMLETKVEEAEESEIKTEVDFSDAKQSHDDVTWTSPTTLTPSNTLETKTSEETEENYFKTEVNDTKTEGGSSDTKQPHNDNGTKTSMTTSTPSNTHETKTSEETEENKIKTEVGSFDAEQSQEENVMETSLTTLTPSNTQETKTTEETDENKIKAEVGSSDAEQSQDENGRKASLKFPQTETLFEYNMSRTSLESAVVSKSDNYTSVEESTKLTIPDVIEETCFNPVQTADRTIAQFEKVVGISSEQKTTDSVAATCSGTKLESGILAEEEKMEERESSLGATIIESDDGAKQALYSNLSDTSILTSSPELMDSHQNNSPLETEVAKPLAAEISPSEASVLIRTEPEDVSLGLAQEKPSGAETSQDMSPKKADFDKTNSLSPIDVSSTKLDLDACEAPIKMETSICKSTPSPSVSNVLCEITNSEAGKAQETSITQDFRTDEKLVDEVHKTRESETFESTPEIHATPKSTVDTQPVGKTVESDETQESTITGKVLEKGENRKLVSYEKVGGTDKIMESTYEDIPEVDKKQFMLSENTIKTENNLELTPVVKPLERNEILKSIPKIVKESFVTDESAAPDKSEMGDMKASTTGSSENNVIKESLATKIPNESVDSQELVLTEQSHDDIEAEKYLKCNIRKMSATPEECLETNEASDSPVTECEVTESEPNKVKEAVELIVKSPGKDDSTGSQTRIPIGSTVNEMIEPATSEGLETDVTTQTLTNDTQEPVEISMTEKTNEVDKIAESVMIENPLKVTEIIENPSALTGESEIAGRLRSLWNVMEKEMQSFANNELLETVKTTVFRLKEKLNEPHSALNLLPEQIEFVDFDKTSATTEGPPKIGETTVIEEAPVEANKMGKSNPDIDEVSGTEIAEAAFDKAAEDLMCDTQHSDESVADSTISVSADSANIDSTLHPDSAGAANDQISQGIDTEKTPSQGCDITEQSESLAQESRGVENSGLDVLDLLQPSISSPRETVGQAEKNISDENIHSETIENMKDGELEEKTPGDIVFDTEDGEKPSHSCVKIDNNCAKETVNITKTLESVESQHSLVSAFDDIENMESITDSSNSVTTEVLSSNDTSVENIQQRCVPDRIVKVISDPEVLCSQACTLIDFDTHLSSYAKAEEGQLLQTNEHGKDCSSKNKFSVPKSTDKSGSSLEKDNVICNKNCMNLSEKMEGCSQNISECIETAEKSSKIECGILQSENSSENNLEHANAERVTEKSKSFEQEIHECLNEDNCKDVAPTVTGMELIPYKNPSALLDSIIEGAKTKDYIPPVNPVDGSEVEISASKTSSETSTYSPISVEEHVPCQDMPDEMAEGSEKSRTENLFELSRSSSDSIENIKFHSEVSLDVETCQTDESSSQQQSSAQCTDSINVKVPELSKGSDAAILPLIDCSKDDVNLKDHSASLETRDESLSVCHNDATPSHTGDKCDPHLTDQLEMTESSVTKETVEHLSSDINDSAKTSLTNEGSRPSHDCAETSLFHDNNSPSVEAKPTIPQVDFNRTDSFEGKCPSPSQVLCVAQSEEESLAVANKENQPIEVCSLVKKTNDSEDYLQGRISFATSAKEAASVMSGKNIEHPLGCSKSNSEAANVFCQDHSVQLVEEPVAEAVTPRVGKEQITSEEMDVTIGNSSLTEASRGLCEPSEKHVNLVPRVSCISPHLPSKSVSESHDLVTKSVDLGVGTDSSSPSNIECDNSDVPRQNLVDESASCRVSDGDSSVVSACNEIQIEVPHPSGNCLEIESPLSDECVSPKKATEVEGSTKNKYSLVKCAEESIDSNARSSLETVVTFEGHKTSSTEDPNIHVVSQCSSVEVSSVEKMLDNELSSCAVVDSDSKAMTETSKSISNEVLSSHSSNFEERKLPVDQFAGNTCVIDSSSDEKVSQEITVCSEIPTEIPDKEIDGTEEKDDSEKKSLTSNNPQDVNPPQKASSSSEREGAATEKASSDEGDENSMLKVVEVKREVCFSGEDSLSMEDTSLSSCNYQVKGGVITILDDKVEDDTAAEPAVLESLCPLCREVLAEPLEEHIIKHHICVSFVPAKSTYDYRNHMVPRVSENLDLTPEFITDEFSYVCRSCQFSSKDINAVRFHLNSHEDIYQVRTGTGSCDCDKKVYSYQFHRWKSLIHNTVYYCGICSYYFACERGLMNHVTALHYVQSRCKICNEEIASDDLVVHLYYHNSDSKREVAEEDVPEIQMTTRSKGCYGVSWNIYDNFLNYLDGKDFRLNVASKVPDENLDRSYLTLPIRNVLDDVTVPDKVKLDPSKDIRKYLQGKKDIRANESEINEALKNFSWFVQMHLEKKSGIKKGKGSNSHGKAKKENDLFDVLGIRTVKLRSSSKKDSGSPDSVKSSKRKSLENKLASPPEETSSSSDPSLTRTRSGMQPSRDESDTLVGDFMSGLGLERNVEVNGEWSREHTYVCCSCGAGYLDLADMMDHKWECHPSVWCAHTMFQGQDSVPQSFCLQFQPPTGRPTKLPATTPLSPVVQAGLSQIIQGTPDPKTEGSADEAKDKNLLKCLRCGLSFAEVEVFHSHLVECGGLHQMVFIKKKNKKGFRFKRRKGQGVPSNRYGASSHPSTPLKAKFGDRSSGLNTPLLDKSHSSLIQSSGVKRRLELAIGSINNHELKNRLKAIISGTKGSSSHTLGVPGRRTIKMKLRKKAFDSRLLRKTRHSDRAKEDTGKVQKGEDATGKVPKNDEKQGVASAKDEKVDVDSQPTKKTLQKKGNLEVGKDKKLQEAGEKSSPLEGGKNKVKKSASSSKLSGGKKSASVSESLVGSENVGVTTSVAAEIPGDLSVAKKKSKGGKKVQAEKKVNGLISTCKQKATSDTKQLDTSASDTKPVDVKKALAKKILAKKVKTISNVMSASLSDKVVNIVDSNSLIGNKEISVQKRLKQSEKQKISKTAPLKTKEVDKAKSKKSKGSQKDLVKPKASTGKTGKLLNSVTDEKVLKAPKKAKHAVPVIAASEMDPQVSLLEIPSQLPLKKKVKETQAKDNKSSGAFSSKTKSPGKVSPSTAASPAKKSKYISSSSSEEIEDDSEDSEPEVIRNFRSGRGCTGRLGLRNKSHPMLARYAFRSCLEPVNREEQDGVEAKEEVVAVGEQPLAKPEASELDLALSSDKGELSDALLLSTKRKRKIANYENQDDCAYVPDENSSDSEDYEDQIIFPSSKRRQMVMRKRRNPPPPTAVATEEEGAKEAAAIGSGLQVGETTELASEPGSSLEMETGPPKKKNQGKNSKRPTFPVKSTKKKYQAKKLKFTRKKSHLVHLSKVSGNEENIFGTDSLDAAENIEGEIPSQQQKKSCNKRQAGKLSTANQDESTVNQGTIEGQKLVPKKKGRRDSNSSLGAVSETSDSKTSGRLKSSRATSSVHVESAKVTQNNIKKASKKKSISASVKGDLTSQAVGQVGTKGENVQGNANSSGLLPQKIKERSSSISLGNLSRAEVVDKKRSKTIKKFRSLSNIPQDISKDTVPLAEQFKKRTLPVRSRTLSELSTRSEEGGIPVLIESTETIGAPEQSDRQTKAKGKNKMPVQKKKALKNRNKVPGFDNQGSESTNLQNLAEHDNSSEISMVKLQQSSVSLRQSEPTKVKSLKGKAKREGVVAGKGSKEPTQLNPVRNMKRVNTVDPGENIVSHSIRRSRFSKLNSLAPNGDQSVKAVEQQTISTDRLVQPADVIAEKVQLGKHILNKKSKYTKKKKKNIVEITDDPIVDKVLLSPESLSAQSESFSSSDELGGVTKNSRKRKVPVKTVVSTSSDNSASDKEIPSGVFIPTKRSKKHTLEDPTGVGVFLPTKKSKVVTGGMLEENQKSKFTSGLSNIIKEKRSKVLNNHLVRKKPAKGKLQVGGCKKDIPENRVKNTKVSKVEEGKDQAFDTMPILEPMNIASPPGADVGSNDNSGDDSAGGEGVSVRVKRRRSSVEKIKDIPTRSTVGSQENPPPPLLHAFTDDQESQNLALPTSSSKEGPTPLKGSKNPVLRKRRTQSSHELGKKDEPPVTSQALPSSSSVEKPGKKKGEKAINAVLKKPSKRKRAASVSGVPKTGPGHVQETKPEETPLAKESKDGLVLAKVKKPSQKKKKTHSLSKKDLEDPKCLDCGLRFDSVASLEDHRQDCITIALEMSLMEAEDHLFECQHCHLTFARKGTHRQHTASCRLGKYKRPLQKHDTKGRRRASGRGANSQVASAPVALPEEALISSNENIPKAHEDCAKEKVNDDSTCVSADNYISQDEPEFLESISHLMECKEQDYLQSTAGSSKLDSMQEFSSTMFKGSPKFRRRSRTNGKVDQVDIEEPVSTSIASEDKCVVCGCEIRDEDMSNKHLLLEQFAHSCQQQPVLEVCVLLAYYNLSIEAVRSLAASAIFYQGSTILKLDAKQQTSPDLDPCLSNTENKSASQLLQILATPHCMWVSSVLEAIAKHYYSVEAVSISGTRQEALKAITVLEELFKEIANIDSTIRKNQMLRTMKETFEAGTL
ncbi:uncharacterized protein [Palaemon carinicauda]|uniref:uncharacterized protein n=1 Tax=Palaemon carinicauda TaxID=392227 RepID=UPI0035B5DEFE